MNWLAGKKTYIVSAAAAGIIFLRSAGFIADGEYAVGALWRGGLGDAACRRGGQVACGSCWARSHSWAC